MVGNRTFRVRQGAILAFAVNYAFSSVAFALPQGAMIANGQVVISQPSAGIMQVKASNGAIINWNQFSIGAGELAKFIQPSASSAVLNRVVGQDASRILGQMQANGRVFLINPNGIVIGAGARIDTNGFVASTLDIADADFLAGKLKFFATGTAGSISNQGLISVGPGGRIALIAPNIENSGIIQAPGGQILLAAGRKIEISSMDFEGVTFEIQAPTDSVLNLGKLLADNGAVKVFAGTLRHSGEIQANRLTQDADGSIRLVGSNEVILTSDSITRADGFAGGAITIQSPGGTTRIGGDISARGSDGKGGDIRLLGDRIAVESGATVDASGSAGGGQILVGGDYQGGNSAVQNASRVFVGDQAQLLADATANGDGGRIIVWANENTRYFGGLSARGGPSGGNGGFAEVSGKQNLEFAGSADLSAAHGTSGFLLLDPLDIIIAANGGRLPVVVDQFADFQTNVVTISPAGLTAVSGSVVLEADRNVYFNTPTAFTGSSLTVSAGKATSGGSIYLNQNLSTSGGSVDLSGYTVSGAGGISTAGGGVNIHVTGGLSYSAPIVSGGGTVALSTSGGSISSANVNAGGGAVSMSAPSGGLFSNSITGGTVTLASSSSQSNTVAASSRINAASSGSSVQIFNGSGTPLRLGTINGSSGVYLYSTAGMEQVAGGSITSSFTYLSGQNVASALGSAAAPLLVASPRLELHNLAAPAYVAFSGGPTVNELYLDGTLAALGSTSISGAGNLTTFSLSNGGTNLNLTAVASGGFGSGLTVRVSDAGINAPTLNVPGPVTIDVAGAATLGTVNSQSLNVTADRAISVTSATASSGGITLSSGSCYYYDPACSNSSPITAGTLTAGGSGSIYLSSSDNGNIDIGALSAGGYLNVSAASYGYYSSTPRTSAVNIGASTVGYGVDIRDYGTGAITFSGALNAGSNVYLNAYHGALSLLGVTSANSGVSGSATGNITFQSITANGYGGTVNLVSSGGGVRTTVDNAAADIVASADVTVSANNATGGVVGDLAFAHPLDILAGASNAVTLSSGTSVGAVGKPVTVDTNGKIVVTSGAGQFHVAAQDATGTQKSVSTIDLTASAAGMGSGGTSVFTSQDLSVNAVSSGTAITIGNIVQSANTLDKFRFAASGASGLTFGDVNLTTTGVTGHPGYAAYNQFFLVSGGAMTQTTPGTNNINAGYISLAAGSGAVTVGNVTSAAVTGNSINISGGAITAGNLNAPALTLSGTNLSLGAVTSAGTHRGYYSGYDYVPRLNGYQYVTDELHLTASGTLTTAGNISSATSAFVLGNGVSVAGGSGTITGGNSAPSYYTDAVNVSAGTGTLAAGNIAAYTVSVAGTTLNTGNITAQTGDLNVSGTNFTTGNLSAAGSLTLSATGIYQPGAIALSSVGTTNITAPGGIDLTTNGATLSAPTTYLRASGGGVSASLTGTSYLDMISGGPVHVSSSTALTYLALQAKGDQLATAALPAAVTATGQIFKFWSPGANTVSLDLSSASGVQVRYTESSAAPTVSDINVTASLGASSFLQISGNGANINANSVVTNGPVNFSTAGNINLNTVNTGGSYLAATSSAGNINVDSVTTVGASVDLTASAGSILKAGSGAVQIDTANAGGASSGEVFLRAANGTVGVGGTPITVSKTVGLTIAAKNDIAVDLAGTTLTDLRITTGASGSGLISITGNPNYAGFSLTRVGGTALQLGAVTPATTSDFKLYATNGNIVVGGDIAVNSLTLNALGASADLLVAASGGPRTIAAPYSADLRAGRDVILSAGAASGENVSVQTGYANIFAGRDIKVQAAGGSALLAMTNTSSQTLSAGRDIRIVGGSAGITGAFAAVTSLGGQQLYARQSDSTGNLLIQAGTADGASAKAQSAYGQTVVANSVSILGGAGAGSSAALVNGGLDMVNLYGGLTVQGGTGSGAFAEIASTGSQSIGNQNTYYYNPTDFILVQGGSNTGTYASIRATGSQNLQTIGDVSVLGGAGSGANAEIYSSGSSQSIGSTYGYYTPATQNILVQAGSGGTARILAASSQSIMGSGNISVIGGSGVGMTASIESTGGSQNIGSGYSSYAYYPTDNVLVQAGSAGGTAAWIKAYSGQTIDAGQSISLTGGSAGAYAEMSTAFGTQTVGNRNSSYDQTDSISVVGGSGPLGYARMTSGGAQVLNTVGAVTVSNAGSDAGAIVAAGTQTVTAASLSVSLSSPLAAAVSEVRAGTNQTINLDGGAGVATLTVANFSGAAGSLAQVKAGGNQVVAMPYSTAAGALQVGDVAAQGQSLLSAGGTQNLLVGSVLVQGGATAAATSKIFSAGNMDISTLGGSVDVLGGAAGSAAIDPPVLSIAADGGVSVLAGSAATATATISGGSVFIAATSGSIVVTGGPVSGATAGIVASPGAATLFGSGSLIITPGVGGASILTLLPGTALLGGSCIGCAAGLSGPFTITTGIFPATVSSTSPLITIIDPSTGTVLALLDGLTDLYGSLAITEEGEIVFDTSRRRLPMCY